MGGKGGAPEEAPIAMDYGQEAGTEEALQGQLMMAMQMMQAMGSGGGAPAMPAAPQVIQAPEIDWSDKTEKLAAKMRADFSLSNAQRHGLSDTMYESPILTETEDESTSILTGSVE